MKIFVCYQNILMKVHNNSLQIFNYDYISTGNYLEAKETLKKMKYYINIKEKIHYLLPHQ